MQFNTVKFLRAENRRLQSVNAKLTGNNEALSLQLKHKEDALAKRRFEVTILHQACAKYKRARHHLSAAAATSLNTAPTIKQTVSTSDVSTTIDADCLRCQKANDAFERQLKVALEGLAEKLSTLFAEKEAQFNTTLREKDGEISKLVATLAAKERAEEESRQRIEWQKAEEQERARQHIEDTIKEMAEIKEQKQRELDERQSQRRRLAEERELQLERESAQRLRQIDERHDQRVRLIHQQFVVLGRQQAGVADAA